MEQYDYYAEGDWNAICGVCGRKGKASEMFKIPSGLPGAGLYAHSYHEAFKQRHPQDLVRGIPDRQAPPWAQPPGADQFVPFCSPEDQSAIPDLAIPGCCRPGYVSILVDSHDCSPEAILDLADLGTADCLTVTLGA